MGRRAQANARTLNWAIRQVFKPVISEVPMKRATIEATEQSATQYIDTDLIPTQPPDQPSAKSLGKRKLVELEDDIDDDGDSEQASQVVAPEQLVQTRYSKSSLPPALKKYWQQRYRLFSRYDEGIQMDYDGWFSVTPENIAAQIAERCRCDVVVDAFCGVGGNAIQFAMTCEKVIAIDTSPVRLACARANAKVYGVEDHITFIQADYLEWAKRRVADPSAESIDVVFLSPPWGGIDYREDQPHNPDASVWLPPGSANLAAKGTYASYPLSRLEPVHGKEIFNISRSLTENIAYFLPRNLDIAEAAALVDPAETVEVEEAWMGSKLKALTVYYGDLALST